MDPAKNDEARRKLTDKGASLVSSLKLRVSRLEATLREKEAELAKLQASTKVTALNEMKIQAETYYQEVVRLRNKLNIAQQQQQRVVVQNSQFPNSKAPRDLLEGVRLNNRGGLGMLGYIEGSGVVDMSGRQRAGGDGQESPTASLRHTIVRLEEENARLSNHLTTSNTEKEKLSTDLERVLGLSEDSKATYESLSRLELIHELEYRQSEVGRLEAQQKHMTEVLSHRNDHNSGESNSILQARMAELQSRELEWERERASLRELINTLKDDRIFYKETAQKKDSDLDALRTEVTSLQQEVISLHESDKKRRDRQRHTPSPLHQRTSRGTYTSRSGSSSEPNTPIHRPREPRPSSARPPAARPARTSKALSEPRDVTERQKRNTDNKRPPGSTRPPSRPPSSASSSPNKIPTHSHSRSSQISSSLTGKPSKTSAGVGRSSSSSVSSPTKGRQTSPYGSPRKAAAGNTSRSTPPFSRSTPSSPSKVPTPLTSPRKTSVPQSPARSITPRSSMSSKNSSPYSSVNSSPVKTASNRNKNNQSPSKSRVPLLKSDSSPSKTSASAGSRTDPNRSSRRKDEKTSSPKPPPLKSSRHRSSTMESSLDQSSSTSPIHKVSSQKSEPNTATSCSLSKDSETPTQNTALPETNSVCLPSNVSMENETLIIVYETEEEPKQNSVLEKKSLESGEEKTKSMETIREDSYESERVLAELVFQNDSDTTTDYDYSTPALERQRTITLSVHGSLEANELFASMEGSVEGSALMRQNTVTLSRSEHSSIEAHSIDIAPDTSTAEGVISNVAASDAELEPSVVEKELVDKDEKDVDESLRKSISEMSESNTSESTDQEIIDNLELLRSLLSSHLSRHQQVNELLSAEPLLMGDVQNSKSSPDRSRSRERPSPDGQEADRSTARSHSLVRQGTFNVIDEEDEGKSVASSIGSTDPSKAQHQSNQHSSAVSSSTTVAHVHATLDSHLTRVNKLHNRHDQPTWNS